MSVSPRIVNTVAIAAALLSVVGILIVAVVASPVAPTAEESVLRVRVSPEEADRVLLTDDERERILDGAGFEVGQVETNLSTEMLPGSFDPRECAWPDTPAEKRGALTSATDPATDGGITLETSALVFATPADATTFLDWFETSRSGPCASFEVDIVSSSERLTVTSNRASVADDVSDEGVRVVSVEYVGAYTGGFDYAGRYVYEQVGNVVTLVFAAADSAERLAEGTWADDAVEGVHDRIVEMLRVRGTES